MRLRPAEQAIGSESVNNFTPRAQQALFLARKEAARFHHNFVGTEHVLLGLIQLGQGTAVAVLSQMGLDLENVRRGGEEKGGGGAGEKRGGPLSHTTPG